LIAPLSFATALTGAGVFAVVLTTVGLEPGPTRDAVAAATTLATLNAVSAVALASIGSGARTTKAFFSAVFGGMVFRMATTLVGILAAVKMFELPAVPFVVTLLAATALFTAAETVVWSRWNFSPRVQAS
jgi:hypothetical protein